MSKQQTIDDGFFLRDGRMKKLNNELVTPEDFSRADEDIGKKWANACITCIDAGQRDTLSDLQDGFNSLMPNADEVGERSQNHMVRAQEQLLEGDFEAYYDRMCLAAQTHCRDMMEADIITAAEFEGVRKSIREHTAVLLREVAANVNEIDYDADHDREQLEPLPHQRDRAGELAELDFERLEYSFEDYDADMDGRSF